MAKQAVILLLVALTSITLSSALPYHRNASTLIVGGVEAIPHSFPWMIDVRKSAHSCGASLLNAEWVITAAHCAQSLITDYTLVAGDHNINVEEGTEQRRKVQIIVNHPHYYPGTFENDVSLMKVSQPFVLNSNVQPATLPSAGFAPTTITTVAGWGRTTYGGSSSPVLLKVDVPYIPDNVCNTAYSGRIKESMLCAGVLGEGGKDACQGDSGGPLMCKSGSTNYLCGLVSWGSGCAQPNYPGVYTEVSFFSEWVKNTIATY